MSTPTLESSLPPSVQGQIKANRRLTKLRAAVQAAGGASADFEKAGKKAGVASYAAMPALASVFEGPAGYVVHVPIQIGRGAGARVSLLKLKKGQSTIAGMYVTSAGVYTREVTRKTGSGALAKGDRFEEKIVDASGKTVQRVSYTATYVDADAGSLRMSNTDTGSGGSRDVVVNGGRGWCWICNGGSSWWCGFPCLPRPSAGGR